MTTDPGTRNHLINQYLSRIADLWIPTDSTEEKISFVNFLATAINSWRPINAEYFREQTRTPSVPAAGGKIGEIRLLRPKLVGEPKKTSRRRGHGPSAKLECQAREAHLAEWKAKNAAGKERNAEIVKLREHSVTYAAIGKQFGISIGRVRQIWMNYLRRESRANRKVVHLPDVQPLSGDDARG